MKWWVQLGRSSSCFQKKMSSNEVQNSQGTSRKSQIFEKPLDRLTGCRRRSNFHPFLLVSNGPMRKDLNAFSDRVLDKCVFWTRVGVRPCIHRERRGVLSKVALTVIICSNLKTDLIPSHYKRCLKLGSLKVTQQFLCLLIIFIVHQDEMGVSKNNGTPKPSICS